MPSSSRLLRAAVTLLALASTASAQKMAVGAPAARMVVVELYQSQGCSSCPPANALLNRLADRPGILPLSFAVTYWDSLGWKDTFATEQFTRRQYDYSHANGGSVVATPQFVVDGQSIISGSQPGALEAAIGQAQTRRAAVSIIHRAGVIELGAGRTSAPATVWLVRYDPRERLVSIGRGENSGRSLPHRNIVTGLRSLGLWLGKPVAFPEPRYIDQAQRSAVLVQAARGGPILAARQLQ